MRKFYFRCQLQETTVGALVAENLRRRQIDAAKLQRTGRVYPQTGRALPGARNEGHLHLETGNQKG
jgi:hypothetical protein